MKGKDTYIGHVLPKLLLQLLLPVKEMEVALKEGVELAAETFGCRFAGRDRRRRQGRRGKRLAHCAECHWDSKTGIGWVD
jgi:hypothetical protein